MKKYFSLFLLLTFCFLTGCKSDASSQLTSVPPSDQGDQLSVKSTLKAQGINNETSSQTDSETQNDVYLFCDTDFGKVRALYKESKDKNGKFKEVKTVTDISELRLFKNSLCQEKWEYHPTSQKWGKFNPSIPNNRVIIIETKQGENYVLHLYSGYDANSCFLSIANYGANMEYDEFVALSDSAKEFRRYTVSKNIYAALMELYS